MSSGTKSLRAVSKAPSLKNTSRVSGSSLRKKRCKSFKHPVHIKQI